MHQDRLGIYVNTKENCAVRISSPYWLPSGADWVLLTSDTNTSLTTIRKAAREKALVADPDSITWGDFAELARRA
jgi:hypothetical protein